MNPFPVQQNTLTTSKISLVLLLLLFGGCTSLTRIPVSEQSHKDWAQYQLQAGRVQQWYIHGRAVIFVGDEVHNVGLKWRHRPDEFMIILEAPFGQGVFRLESMNSGALVKLSLPDGNVVYGEDAEATLGKVLGWSIPVSGLEFWIKGLPLKPEIFTQVLNGDGRLRSLQQKGWSIRYLDYFGFDHPAKGLPKKLYLKHEELALKIVVDSWQKPETDADSNIELFPDFN
ncbi:MAG: outer membrane lipoprotein LolB [Gammaproteobacteria bacterium]|nr:outer membrane lipoprotein LolB [Gammaproteobacteria bacterium]